ncbi:helix-turn-helix transcriptional regulator [Kineococcus glutinatus]|uniref:helix-turn-helix transcriptional regulator n=1 Tax=Kineococcus glutinatus TaxID=1070872 RepID=UPI0031F176E7
MSTEAQRRELGALLRARRVQLDRAALGLPPVPRSRTGGLRREEVSALSGVSVTWYTWLEQGRDIHPSRQVLDAVARALRLSAAEHAYVLSLAGLPALTAASPAVAPAHVQRLLDALHGSPAFALTSAWDIAAWNAAYAVLYPHIGSGADRNLLWSVFTDPYVRELLPDWDTDSRRFLAEFRAEAGPHLGEPAVAALVARLSAASEEFRAGWTGGGVEGFTSRERLFHHPRVGDLRLEQHRLVPADVPGLSVVVYTPVDDGRTPAALAALLG